MSEVRRVELTPEIRSKLAATSLLGTLSAEDLDAGLEQCPLVEVPPAMRVIEQGEYDDRFYILVSGRCSVSIQKKGADHGATVARIAAGKHAESTGAAAVSAKAIGGLSAGDFFGELACMSPWPRNSTVLTTTKSLILEIDSDVFEDWMAASEGFRAIMEEAYMTRGLMALLRGLRAFAPLGDDALQELLEGATPHSFEKDGAIVTEGEDGDAFYVIRGGVVAVSKRVGDQEKIVSYLRAGSFFGEMALLDGEPRSATCTATNQTEVIRISRERFAAIVGRFPEAKQEMRRIVNERNEAGERVLGDEGMADALTFMAGQGILGGMDVLVVDLQKCIYCGYCEEACAATHEVSLISLHGPMHKKHLFPTACRNCDDPVCLKKCPVDAITRDRDGEVKIADHCVGCSGCAIMCPYDTISLTPISVEEGERAREKAGFKKPVTQQAIKCNLCEDIPTGPQCVRSCPTAAILRFKPKQLVEHVLKKD